MATAAATIGFFNGIGLGVGQGHFAAGRYAYGRPEGVSVHWSKGRPAPQVVSSSSSFLLSRFRVVELSLNMRKAPSGSVSRGDIGVRSALRTSTEKVEKATAINGGAKQDLLHFVKYHGLGNDFLLVDNRNFEEPKITEEQAIALCDRNFGVGGDGVIFVLPGTSGSDYNMRIYNSDGSEPEMCGNGIRCMAKFVAELEGTTEEKSFRINTLGGLIVPRLLEDGQVCVDMGPPILEAEKIPTTLSPNQNNAVINLPLLIDGETWNVTCVSMGNPHCVVILDNTKDLSDLPLSSTGPLFECHKVFPAKTNTEFVQVLSRSRLRMRVWERGAGATLACGTGACALVVAAVLEGRADRKCVVELPGGPLEIDWREDNHLYMTGPAQKVFAGAAFL